MIPPLSICASDVVWRPWLVVAFISLYLGLTIALSTPAHPDTLDDEPGRQVWFIKRARELKLPFKVCEVKLPRRARAQVSLSSSAMSITVEPSLLRDLRSLELTFDAPLALGEVMGERAPEPCSQTLSALVVLQDEPQGEAGAQQSPRVSVHIDSGSVNIMGLVATSESPTWVALADEGRVRTLVSCERSSCLLSLSQSEVRALTAQAFKRRRGKKRAQSRRFYRADPLQFLIIKGALPLYEGDTFVNLSGASDALLVRARQLKFELTQSLVLDAKLDASQEPALLPLSYPELVSEVKCNKARCVLDKKGVRVFSLDRGIAKLKLQLSLKQGVERVDRRGATRAERVKLPIERCLVKAPEVELLGGVPRHHLPIALARSCFKGKARSLKLKTWPPVEAYFNRELPIDHPSWRFFDVVFEDLPPVGRSLEVSVLTRSASETLLGELTLPISHNYRPTQLRLKLERLGLIDFLPTNQEASLLPVFGDPTWANKLKVQSHYGFYRVQQSSSGPLGEVKLNSAPDARGIIPLRLTYTPLLTAPFELLYPFALAEVTSEARYPLREVNLPLTLTHANAQESIVEVTCLDGSGEIVNLTPGLVGLIPYESRHSCRVMIHRARVPKWAGAQHILIMAGKFKRLVRVRHGVGSLTIHVPTDRYKEFQRLSIRVGHDYSSAEYDFSPQQDLGEEARFDVVLGDRSFNISISTALPTGLYRFGVDEGESDNVSLSAGGLARLMWLYKPGTPFPLGIDLGVLGTEINESPHLSFVGGIGLSVPVLNANTPLEASFNLHAWLEYSPTRTGPDESAWGLLFGPSFAVGKFSTHL